MSSGAREGTTFDHCTATARTTIGNICFRVFGILLGLVILVISAARHDESVCPEFSSRILGFLSGAIEEVGGVDITLVNGWCHENIEGMLYIVDG